MIGIILVNKHVIKKMMTTPFTAYPQGKPDSMGDRVELAPISNKCYVHETMQMVINSQGQEELSNLQIYVPGELGVTIEPTAKISCLGHDKQRIIKRVVSYGRFSKPVIAVFYLP